MSPPYQNGHLNSGQRFVELYIDAIINKRLQLLLSLYRPNASLTVLGNTWTGLRQIEQFYQLFLAGLRAYELTDADSLSQTNQTAAFSVVIIRTDMATQMLNNVVLQSSQAHHHLMLATQA